MSTSVLDSSDGPPTKSPFMRIWHTNTEDATAMSRTTEVPIPTEPQITEADTEVTEESLSSILLAASAAATRPKRKRGNDSVSRGPYVYRF